MRVKDFLIIVLRAWGICIVLQGCSVAPVSLSEEELSKQIDQSIKNLTEGQESLNGNLTLSEAIARAIKYNLDYRVQYAERVLAETSLSVDSYDLLPNIIANAQLDGRDKYRASISGSQINDFRPNIGGSGSNTFSNYSTSSEKEIITADLGLSWNVLDFGLSYVSAKQAADRILIVEQEKRKIIAQIVKDVRNAYWKVVGHERLKIKLENLLSRVSNVLKESRQISNRRLDSPLTALSYQRELITIKRELEKNLRQLSLSKIRLAALINYNPGIDFTIYIPAPVKSLKRIIASSSTLERIALENRPEIHSIVYQKRINSREAKKALLKLLPNANFDITANTSNNDDYLLHTNWLGYGAQVTWSLLNAFKLGAQNRRIDAQKNLLYTKQLALSMAIITQVNVSMALYHHTVKEFMSAVEYQDVQNRIFNQVRSQALANKISQQQLIREEMHTLLSQVKTDIAYADLEDAYADILLSIGIDPLPKDFITDDISVMENEINQYYDKILSRYQLFRIEPLPL